MCKILPSIMCANMMKVGSQVRSLENAGASALHLDVMDGHFVPGFTFGIDFVRQLREYTAMDLDVHLMSDQPLSHMTDFLQAGVSSMTIHAEVNIDLYRCILKIKRHNTKAGIALNPSTPIHVLDEILPELDYVLVMTVNPGNIGQTMIPSCMMKASKLVNHLTERGLTTTKVVVDGGIKLHNIREVSEIGVHGAVVGTGIFSFPDTGHAFKSIVQAI